MKHSLTPPKLALTALLTAGILLFAACTAESAGTTTASTNAPIPEAITTAPTTTTPPAVTTPPKPVDPPKPETDPTTALLNAMADFGCPADRIPTVQREVNADERAKIDGFYFDPYVRAILCCESFTAPEEIDLRGLMYCGVRLPDPTGKDPDGVRVNQSPSMAESRAICDEIGDEILKNFDCTRWTPAEFNYTTETYLGISFTEKLGQNMMRVRPQNVKQVPSAYYSETYDAYYQFFNDVGFDVAKIIDAWYTENGNYLVHHSNSMSDSVVVLLTPNGDSFYVSMVLDLMDWTKINSDYAPEPTVEEIIAAYFESRTASDADTIANILQDYTIDELIANESARLATAKAAGITKLTSTYKIIDTVKHKTYTNYLVVETVQYLKASGMQTRKVVHTLLFTHYGNNTNVRLVNSGYVEHYLDFASGGYVPDTLQQTAPLADMTAFGCPADRLPVIDGMANAEERAKINEFYNDPYVWAILCCNTFTAPEDIDLRGFMYCGVRVHSDGHPIYDEGEHVNGSASQAEEDAVCAMIGNDSLKNFECIRWTSAELNYATQTYLGIPFTAKVGQNMMVTLPESKKQNPSAHYLADTDAYYHFCTDSGFNLPIIVGVWRTADGNYLVESAASDFGNSIVALLTPNGDSFYITMVMDLMDWTAINS